MYDMQWGEKTPGLLIFLIDQSGSMEFGNKHEKVVKAVQDAVWDCLLGCVNGPEIRNRFYLHIIGYGEGVNVVWSSWIGDKILDQKLKEANNNKRSFIDAISDGVTPMASAFDQANDKITDWISKCQKQVTSGDLNGIPAPIVVNITDGAPQEYGMSDSEAVANTKKSAQRLLNTKTEDGNVILFNLHLADENSKSVLFPKELGELDGSKEGELLYDISSTLDDKMVLTAKRSGLETARIGSKGMIVNASSELIPKFISFGSAVSGVAK